MSTMSQSAVPQPPREAPEGFSWHVEPAGDEWAVAEPGRTCRHRGKGDRACGQLAVLCWLRGLGHLVRWFYCAEHAADPYGHWLGAGTVMHWTLRKADGDGPVSS